MSACEASLPVGEGGRLSPEVLARAPPGPAAAWSRAQAAAAWPLAPPCRACGRRRQPSRHRACAATAATALVLELRPVPPGPVPRPRLTLRPSRQRAGRRAATAAASPRRSRRCVSTRSSEAQPKQRQLLPPLLPAAPHPFPLQPSTWEPPTVRRVPRRAQARGLEEPLAPPDLARRGAPRAGSGHGLAVSPDPCPPSLLWKLPVRALTTSPTRAGAGAKRRRGAARAATPRSSRCAPGRSCGVRRGWGL